MLVLGNSRLTHHIHSEVPARTGLGGIPPGRDRPRWRAAATGGAAAALALFWVVGVPQAAAAPLSVSLDCDDTLVEVDGTVDCTADVADQAPDATIVYSWTLDGQAQQEVDSELSLSDVRVGTHTVTVVARDTAHGISAAPQSTTFSRDSDLSVPPLDLNP